MIEPAVNVRDGVSVIAEWFPLRKVVMCSPSGFRVIPAINETQAHFFVSDPPGLAELSEEHSEVVSLLSRAGVDVVMLSPDQAMPMQINTRDVGFVIGDSYFVSHMGRQIRQEIGRASCRERV